MGSSDHPGDSHEPLRAADGAGFAIEVDGVEGELGCRHVRGFRDALVAATDPHADVPPQLVLVAPSPAAATWLARWAEDTRCVRRSVALRRQSDGARVTAIASLASYGYGIETALLVESIAPVLPGMPGIVRSGVHPKEAVDAVLGRPRP
jgi:hypothetical protein